jgi:catechol 2,3-dioxygenase-like lactoylglutathione lyase family enzyme
MRLDHFTLRTRKPAETVRFYTDVLGVKEGWRPPFNFPGHWLYQGEIPIVHIITIAENEREVRAYVGERTNDGPGSGSVDHIAFRCQGLDTYQDRLLELGYTFHERVVPMLDQHQLFVKDPNGIMLELVFDAAESKGIRGTAMSPSKMKEPAKAGD